MAAGAQRQAGLGGGPSLYRSLLHTKRRDKLYPAVVAHAKHTRAGWLNRTDVSICVSLSICRHIAQIQALIRWAAYCGLKRVIRRALIQNNVPGGVIHYDRSRTGAFPVVRLMPPVMDDAGSRAD